MARKRPQRPTERPMSPAQEEKQIRGRLVELQAERNALNREESRLVEELRARRCTWEDIGEATGLSRGGAHRKWGASTKDE